MSLALRLHHLGRRAALRLLPIALVGLTSASCGPRGGGVDDELSAELAYRGLDRGIDRIIELGFKGFNEAGSANIPPQTASGDAGGTMDVGGQVDQGASNNKGMRLTVALSDYSDGPPAGSDLVIVYNGSLDTADLSMKGLPDADLTGTLVGNLAMDGDLQGNLALNLSITGMTMDAGGGLIARAPGTIHVTGTATSDYGVFNVDVSL